jgi:hypothetical protein
MSRSDLKKIRLSFNIALRKLSTASGVKMDTLFRLENGLIDWQEQADDHWFDYYFYKIASGYRDLGINDPKTYGKTLEKLYSGEISYDDL